MLSRRCASWQEDEAALEIALGALLVSPNRRQGRDLQAQFHIQALAFREILMSTCMCSEFEHGPHRLQTTITHGHNLLSVHHI